jgi:hypothetical protein
MLRGFPVRAMNDKPLADIIHECFIPFRPANLNEF